MDSLFAIEDTTPELVINFWQIYDNTGICYAVRAKVYAMRGSNEEKLAALKALAWEDWRTAAMYDVPERFHLVLPDGKKMRAVHLGGLNTTFTLADLFTDAMDALPATLPADCILEIPYAPLVVMTPLYFSDDGTMEARPKP